MVAYTLVIARAIFSRYYFHHPSIIQNLISMADLTIASASSSEASTSTAASTPYPRYDVFINHRGRDVKNTFASHLYRQLHDRGLQVFLDREELVEGHLFSHQIEEAIRGASVHVAIFSPNYAESEWCLKELVYMVNSQAKILPVFYNVEPSELRRTTGSYGVALQNLQQKSTRDHQTGEDKPRYDADIIQSWREALSYVAGISGFELRGDESDLLEEVVRGVLKKVPKTLLQVATYPTGLANKLEEFERTVLAAEEDVKTVGAKVVGIVGHGGVGKSTLAKHFFNLKKSQFYESSFLFDVRENARTMGLSDLQSQLIHELKHRRIEIKSDDQGIEILKKHLLSCHALIILDDIDRINQMEAFLPVTDILSPDSLIVVTSRDKHVLRSAGILESSIYYMKGLNKQDSQVLFCRHAFHQHPPRREFEDLVGRFVTECDGLPLSLKVFGALVCGKEESYWNGILVELHERLPGEIQERLIISYESLDKNDQSIFLDIVFFFIGEAIEEARRIWGTVGVVHLEDKCLLEVDSKSKIKMHDHIRDMGRGIAQEGSIPRRLSEMRHLSHIDEVLERSSAGTTQVRGISLVHSTTPGLHKSHPQMVWDSKMSRFKRWMHEVMRNCEWKLFNNNRYYATSLKILVTEDGYLKSILRRVRSPELIWLRWYRCPYSCLPSWVPMNNIRVLEVFGSRLKMLWQSEKAPLDLRGLTIAAPLSHFPKSIGQLQYLEKIVVKSEDGVPLKALPEEFCNLRSLKYLELRWCKRMISLPESFGKLTNLQHIDLLGAFTLQSLPYSFRNLTRLKHLNLSLCMSLKMSSGILGSGCPVEYLSLEYCDNVEELLSQVALQSSLETLILRRLDFKEIPSAIGGLSNLEYLWIGESIYERCNMMEEFPPSHFCLENLKTLYVESCPKLKCLHAFSEAFPQLTSLRISGCAILEYLPEDLLSLKNLRELNVHFCPLRELPLNKLDSKDKCVSGLETLNLYKVNISEVSFRVCPNLQNLYLSGCQQLRHIGELCGLAKLRQLRIGDCPNLEELPSLETLMSLAYIEVCKCPKVKSIQGLAELTKLRVLRVYNLDELRELPGVEHVNSLEVLDVRKCPKLQWGEGVLEQLRPLMETSYSRNSQESKRSFPRQFLECCLPFLLPWKSKG